MFGSEEGWKQAHSFADKLLKECHDVEDRLGLPHLDEKQPLPGMKGDLRDDNLDEDDLLTVKAAD